MEVGPLTGKEFIAKCCGMCTHFDDCCIRIDAYESGRVAASVYLYDVTYDSDCNRFYKCRYYNPSSGKLLLDVIDYLKQIDAKLGQLVKRND